jgi:hypothetical protein
MKAERHAYWATLLPLLEARVARWTSSELTSLMTPEELRESRITSMVEQWQWLLPLAVEMNARPELAPFVPFVSVTTIRLMHPDKMGQGNDEADMLHCHAVSQDQFEIQAVWPRTERQYGYEMDHTVVFEGDAKSAADFIARLVANVEVKSAGNTPLNPGQSTE